MQMQLYLSMTTLPKLSPPLFVVAKHISSTAVPHPLAGNINRFSECPIKICSSKNSVKI